MSDASERSVKICTFEQHNRLCICMFMNVYRLSKVTQSVSVTSWRIVKKTHICQRSTIQIKKLLLLRFILFSSWQIKINEKNFLRSFIIGNVIIFSPFETTRNTSYNFFDVVIRVHLSMLQCKTPEDFLFLKSEAEGKGEGAIQTHHYTCIYEAHMPWRSHDYHACSYILWMEQTKDLWKDILEKSKNESNRYQI